MFCWLACPELWLPSKNTVCMWSFSFLLPLLALYQEYKAPFPCTLSHQAPLCLLVWGFCAQGSETDLCPHVLVPMRLLCLFSHCQTHGRGDSSSLSLLGLVTLSLDTLFPFGHISLSILATRSELPSPQDPNSSPSPPTNIFGETESYLRKCRCKISL